MGFWQKSFLLVLLLLLIEASRFLLIVYLPSINGSVSLFLILFILLLINFNYRIILYPYISFFLFAICFFITIETLYFFYKSPSFNNLFNGIFVVPLFIFIIYLFSIFLLKSDSNIISFSFKIAAYLLLFLGWLSIAFPNINNMLGYNYNNPVFPFTEPSHYAISLMPLILAYGINASNRVKLFLIFNMILLAFLFPNLTLLISVIFVIFMFWGINHLKLSLLAFTLLIFVLFVLLLKVPYFSSRLLNFGTESDNLSVLVYIQGWQDMIKAFKETNGLGLGYRMMGTNSPSEIALRIKSLGFGELNRTDGSFLASKLITEFGIMGIGFIIFYFAYLVKFFKWIFRQGKSFEIKKALLFSLCSSIIIELLIRGGDYFSSQVILSLSSFITLTMLYINENHYRRKCLIE